VIHTDEEFLATLNAEEKDFYENSFVVLNQNNWDRANDELLVGMKVADQSFLDKVQKEYGYSFELDEGTFANPSLYLVGRQDNVTGYSDAFNILEKYPRATYTVLDTAGHNLQIEQAELVNGHVSEWLERVSRFV
jgi:pimeloyl-ACP methyl ester carboxylesterase